MRPSGAVAEWLGRGLQSLVHQFDSGRRLFCASSSSQSFPSACCRRPSICSRSQHCQGICWGHDVHNWTAAAVVAGLAVTVTAVALAAKPLKRFFPLLGLGGLVAFALFVVAVFGNSLN